MSEIQKYEQMSDSELLEFQDYLEKKNRPFYKKIWDGLVLVLGYIIYGITLIFAFIVGIGGCLWEVLKVAIFFFIGWWVITGIWNWIF